MYQHPMEEFSAFLEHTYPEETIDVGKYGAKSVTIQVTDSCNLCCTYCYQINKNHHFIKIDDCKKFIDYILFSDTKYCGIHQTAGLILEFIGGEPFLAIDVIAETTEYLFHRMMETNHPWLYRTKISICSNGTLYFEPKVQAYIRKWHKVISFGISVDGNKQLHDKCRVFADGSGSYDMAIAARNHYKKTYGIEAETKMTLAPSNIEYTYDAIKSLIDNGYKHVAFNCVFEEGWNINHAKVYYEELKKIADLILSDDYILHNVYLSRFNEYAYGPKNPSDDKNSCGGLGDMLAINYTGKMFPCLRYMESSLGKDVPEVIIGDLETGIMQKDEYSELVDLMKSCTRRTQSTDECFYCPIGDGCRSCSAYDYQYYGKFGKRTTFLCIMHKTEAIANAYYWNKFYLQEKINKVFLIHIPEDWALEIVSKEEYDMIKNLERQCLENIRLNETTHSKEDI